MQKHLRKIHLKDRTIFMSKLKIRDAAIKKDLHENKTQNNKNFIFFTPSLPLKGLIMRKRCVWNNS